MTYNAITDTTLLSVKRYGSATLVAGSGETLTEDVGHRPEGVPLKYTHIDTGALAEMSAGEKTTVDDATATIISAARTLTAKTAGVYCVDQSASAGYIITLPTAASGIAYEFLLTAETAFPVTIRLSVVHQEHAFIKTQTSASSSLFSISVSITGRALN